NRRNVETITRLDVKQPLISLTLIGSSLYFTSISLEDAKKIDEDADYQPANSVFTVTVDKPDQEPRKLTANREGRLWGELAPSADGRFLAVRYAEQSGRHVALLDTASGKEISSFTERSAAWSASGALVLF